MAGDTITVAEVAPGKGALVLTDHIASQIGEALLGGEVAIVVVAGVHPAMEATTEA